MKFVASGFLAPAKDWKKSLASAEIPAIMHTGFMGKKHFIVIKFDPGLYEEVLKKLHLDIPHPDILMGLEKKYFGLSEEQAVIRPYIRHGKEHRPAEFHKITIIIE